MKVTAVNFCTSVPQSFDEATLKVRCDGQRAPTEDGTQVQPRCVSLYLVKHFDVSDIAFVLEKGVDNGERRPVLAKDVECEHLEVCDWSTSERPVNADSFCVAQQPISPLPRKNDVAFVVAYEYTISASVGVTTMSSALWGCCPLIRIFRASRKSVLFLLHVFDALRTHETSVFVWTYLFRSTLAFHYVPLINNLDIFCFFFILFPHLNSSFSFSFHSLLFLFYW